MEFKTKRSSVSNMNAVKLINKSPKSSNNQLKHKWKKERSAANFLLATRAKIDKLAEK